MEPRYRWRELALLLAGLLMLVTGVSELLHRAGFESAASAGWEAIWPLAAMVLGIALMVFAWSDRDEHHAQE